MSYSGAQAWNQCLVVVGRPVGPDSWLSWVEGGQAREPCAFSEMLCVPPTSEEWRTSLKSTLISEK